MQLARNTKILLYNGDTKYVSELKINDLLMGSDSTQRKIKKITDSNTILYRISTSKGDYYDVNDNCSLLLKKEDSLKTYEIKLKDFIKRDDKELFFGYQKIVSFKEISVENPYNYGLNMDKTNLSIEKIYKCNSIKNRKELLNGIIDNINITTKINDKSIKIIYSDDIYYLILSLGLYCININNNIYVSLDFNNLYHSIKIEKIGKTLSSMIDIYENDKRIFLGNFIVISL